MAIHRPYNRPVVCAPGAKMATVGSLLLGKGQIGIYDVMETDKDGMVAVTSFDGKRTDEKRYQILVGRGDKDAQPFSSPVFSIDEITDVYASAPKTDRQFMDDVVFGFNGSDKSTGIKGRKGDRIPIELFVKQGALNYLGIPGGKMRFVDYILFDGCSHTPESSCDQCDPCEDVECLGPVLETIERLKRQRINSDTNLGDIIDITPVHSCTSAGTPPTETDMNFLCMTVCDTGDDYALAMVRNQYPGIKIERVDYNGGISKYQALTEKSALSAYEQRLSTIIKGCENCPDGYTPVEGGYIYAVTIEDEGDDRSSDIETLANAVSGTTEKLKGQRHGVGLYTIVLSKKLSKSDLETFLTTYTTATVSFLTKSIDMCSNPTVTSSDWTNCGSCKVTKHKYYITIPDTECGTSAISEIQAAYPDLVIQNYDNVMPAAGCMHSFVTEVATNMVCKECDDVFKDMYRSEAPGDYMGRKWRKVADTTPVSGCVCGIRFRAKDIKFSPTNCMFDETGYVEDSVRISVRGGYPDSFNELSQIYNNPIHVEYLERWAPRTHVGADFVDDENVGYRYFSGLNRQSDYMGRMLRGEETILEYDKQYADISVTIRPVRDSNGFGRLHAMHETFHIIVKFGSHDGILEMVNMLAAKAGLKPAKI